MTTGHKTPRNKHSTCWDITGVTLYMDISGSHWFDPQITLLYFVLFKLYSGLGFVILIRLWIVKGGTAHILGANLRNLKNALDTSSSAITKVVSEAVEEARGCCEKVQRRKEERESVGKERRSGVEQYRE